MAVHHRQPYSPYKLTSAMLGLITDSVLKEQKKTLSYKKGVQDLLNILWKAFETCEPGELIVASSH